MPNFVLKHWHPMVGMDYHIPWPPGSPSPAPAPVPYFTTSLLIGIAPTVFSKPIMTHMTDGFAITMEKGTDIGSLIPHIGAPSCTLPVEIALSASKSHFGAARYQAEGKIMGCALLVTVNPNLNCGTPAPTPTGFVIAITTHIVEMSLADVLGGLASMCADIALQWLLNKIGSAISGRIQAAIMRQIRPSIWVNTFCNLANRGASESSAMFRATEAVLRTSRSLDRVTGTVVGFFMGGPLGMDVSTVTGWSPGGAVSGGISGMAEEGGRELADMISPPEPVTDYNSGPGAPPVANP